MKGCFLLSLMLATLAALPLMMVVTGCSESESEMVAPVVEPESETRVLANEAATQFEEASAVLASVTDVASAQAATESLRGIIGEMRDLTEQLKEVEDPSDEDEAWIQSDIKPRVAAAVGEARGEVGRIISQPTLRDVMMEAQIELAAAMFELQFAPTMADRLERVRALRDRAAEGLGNLRDDWQGTEDPDPDATDESDSDAVDSNEADPAE